MSSTHVRKFGRRGRLLDLARKSELARRIGLQCRSTINVELQTNAERSVTVEAKQSRRNSRGLSNVAGIEFIEENGGGPGVRLKKSIKGKGRK